jgi:hypothetical protein
LRRFDPLELAKDALEFAGWDTAACVTYDNLDGDLLRISKTFRFAERAARNSDGGPLDPADIKSIQYVVGRVEDRGKCGLLSTVARWHMRYLLRQISRR